jgi:4,5-DOPA dioxygenase extradiol
MTPTMPAVFVGHGNPMNALEHNRYTEAWRQFGQAVPRPEAVLCVSAHWYVNATAVTAMSRPRTIHDFYGFPQALFEVEYPAPGSSAIADAVVRAVDPVWVGLDHDSWGIDHGTWSVLVHMFPEADVPVLQLAINAMQPLDYHLDLGARLAPLREQGVLVVASGNVVHNLRRIQPALGDTGTEAAHRFDTEAQRLMVNEPASVLDLTAHPDVDYAVPTPDHFIPLLYLAGLAREAGRPCRTLVDGYVWGSLSMTAYTLDFDDDVATVSSHGAEAFVPDPARVPPEGTNI